MTGTSLFAPPVAIASNSNLGIVQPDGTTITINAGVISATGGAATSVVVGTTTVGSGTSNGLLFDNAGKLGNLATANSGVLVTNSSGVPSISSTLPAGLTIPGYASSTATLTLGNTTLTLGGTTTTIGGLTLTSPAITGTVTGNATHPNAVLVNSAVTIGSTSVSLGATAATIAGLTLTAPTATGTLTAATITASGVISTSNTTDSSSSTTGSLIINGGLGLAGNIYGGENAVFSGSVLAYSQPSVNISQTGFYAGGYNWNVVNSSAASNGRIMHFYMDNSSTCYFQYVNDAANHGTYMMEFSGGDGVSTNTVTIPVNFSLTGIPSSNPGGSGLVWRNGNVLNIT